MQDQDLPSQPEDGDDLSGAEYLARDDREKRVGYNHLPHRPARPSRQTQLQTARQGERHRADEDAG
jgi:hypothetical protein